jgi:CBS domain-containing protein
MGITTDPVETISQLDPLSTLLLWLGPVNLIVGIFNLIPGFPLDGGRILRSILWGATSNLRRATRWAAGVGHLIAWFFIIAGIAMAFGAQVPIFGSGLINGLWLAFIGWFLNSAASSGYQQIVIQDLLEDVPVERIMRVEGPTVPPHLPVSYLVYKWIIGTDERAFPVIVGDRMVGLVCLDDVRKLPREEWGCTTVSDIMTRFDQLAFVSPQENASSALNKLEMRNLGMIPVVQEGRLVGLLRRRDIIRWLQLQSDFATS